MNNWMKRGVSKSSSSVKSHANFSQIISSSLKHHFQIEQFNSVSYVILFFSSFF